MYGCLQRLIGRSVAYPSRMRSCSDGVWRMLCALVGSFCLHAVLFFALDAPRDSGTWKSSKGESLVAVLQPRATVVPIDPDALVGQERMSVADSSPSVESKVAAGRDAPEPYVPERREVAGPPSMDATYYPIEKLTKRPRLLRDPDLDRKDVRAIHASGKLRLQLWVSPSGSVVRVVPDANGLPEELVRLVVRAFEGVVYTPGELMGVPVGALIRVEVDFDDRALLAPNE